jgi:hypothetical protein
VSGTKRTNVPQLLAEMSKLALQQPLLIHPVPPRFVSVHNTLTKMKDRFPFLTWDQYFDFVKVRGNYVKLIDYPKGFVGIQEDAIPSLTSFLHDVGTIIHFEHQLVILDPLWLSQVMSSIVS